MKKSLRTEIIYGILVVAASCFLGGMLEKYFFSPSLWWVGALIGGLFSMVLGAPRAIAKAIAETIREVSVSVYNLPYRLVFTTFGKYYLCAMAMIMTIWVEFLYVLLAAILLTSGIPLKSIWLFTGIIVACAALLSALIALDMTFYYPGLHPDERLKRMLQEAKWLFKRFNPVSAPFYSAFKMIQGIVWLIARLPKAMRFIGRSLAIFVVRMEVNLRGHFWPGWFISTVLGCIFCHFTGNNVIAGILIGVIVYPILHVSMWLGAIYFRVRLSLARY